MSKVKFLVNISDSERKYLEKTINNPKLTNRVKIRFQIIISISSGNTPSNVAKDLSITRKTVYKWLERYITYGRYALMDKPRTGRPRNINENTLLLISNLTDKKPPDGKDNWSIRELAKHANISTWQVRKASKSLK